MRKDFSSISYNPVVSATDEKNSSSTFTTAEQIDVKNAYTANDLKNAEHLHFAAGIPPFLRGPYSSMYVQNLGLSDSMRVSAPPKRVMLFIAAI